MMMDRDRATRAVRRHYDLFAPIYDRVVGEGSKVSRWRRLLWSRADGGRILEVGVGTGGSFPHYPPQAQITGIDISNRMLGRARRKAARRDLQLDLRQMDVQALDFPDGSFDTVVASLVFCSVPDPALGLREIARVCRQGGQVLLLDHVLSDNRLVAGAMHLLNPLARLLGDNLTRETVREVAESPLEIERVTDLSPRFLKLIEARKA